MDAPEIFDHLDFGGARRAAVNDVDIRSEKVLLGMAFDVPGCRGLTVPM